MKKIMVLMLISLILASCYLFEERKEYVSITQDVSFYSMERYRVTTEVIAYNKNHTIWDMDDISEDVDKEKLKDVKAAQKEWARKKAKQFLKEIRENECSHDYEEIE